MTAAVLLSASAYADGGVPRYSLWFDSDTQAAGSGTLGSSSLTLEIDAGALTAGVHTVQLMVTDANGVQSAVVSQPFYKRVTLAGGTAYVYIDGEFTQAIPETSGAGQYTAELDLNSFGTGLHTIRTLVVSADEVMSSVKESVFLRVPTSTELQDLRCYYTIDNDEGQLYGGSMSGNILYADIDASALTDGLHSISFMLVGQTGLTTEFKTAYFLKLPVGGVNLKSYSYWLNTDSDHAVTVNVKDAPNPYILTSLVPLESQPFRSSSFHFAVEDGVETVYPRNDFHILLSDNRGLFTAQSFPYYDVAGRQDVSDKITEFGGSSMRINRIPANEISWYSFNAQKGDSISFRLNATCAFEIYAPDGEKLFSSSADKSRSAVGGHTPQTGKHYIAVHDQLGAVSYFTAYLNVIDKFALLRFDPAEFGADGMVIFHMDGNGFDRLKGVSLTKDGVTAAESDNLETADWSYSMARFDLSDKNLQTGKYDLSLHFEDENGAETVVSKPVSVKKAVINEFRVTVNPHNRTFTDVRDIDVTVTNPSNVGFWGVPFCVARTSQDPAFGFKFKMFKAEENDCFNDPVYYDTDNLLGMGRTGRYLPMVIPYIGPGEKLVYTFSVPRVVNNNFNFYAWCGEPWSEEAKRLEALKSPVRKAVSQEQLDANYARLESLQGALGQLGDHAPKPIDRAAQLTNLSISAGCAIAGVYAGLDAARHEAYNEAYPGFDELVGDAMPRIKVPSAMTPIGILNNSGLLPIDLPENAGAYGMLAADAANAASCCNPRPKGCGVVFPSSRDPNDIIGYLSDAGTKHVGKAVRTLGYTVEFENDPEFATSSAMTVKVDNQLDRKAFDLASFSPKSLRIGKKTLTFDEEQTSQVATVDMRPEINGIAQVTLDYDKAEGRISLLIETLNPYTMDLSDDISQGILPVNHSGEGIGEFVYEVGLKNGVTHKTVITNSATIVFDTNDPIQTPVWENVTDYISPTSEILSVSASDDGLTYTFGLEGSDADSGIWRYDLYMRSAENSEWTLVREGMTEDDCTHTFATAPTSPQFRTVAVDMAGNVEENEVNTSVRGDVDGNGHVDANDLVLLYSYYVGRPVTIDLTAGDLNNDGRIDSQDTVALQRIYIEQTLSRSIRHRLINFKR